ncbi:nitrate/nitrite two-component system sensor histidine kinase NarQ [Vibrio paucivorans]
MLKSVKRSVTRTIAKAMSLIVLLSIATTSFAIITLASSLNDAEAVNIAGSMRMQSYRLAHDIQISSVDFSEHIELFERSIYSPSMKALQNWTVPDDITNDYYLLIIRWHELKDVLQSPNNDHYLELVAGFVSQIDAFVYKLQEFSELKLIKLAWVGGIGLGAILLLAVYVVHFVRREVVKPLQALVIASEQITSRSFDVELDTSSNSEMGILARTFNHMASDLGKLYRGLEKAVNEKTHKLQHANHSLEVLYKSSQELTAARITQDNFEAILKQIVSLEGVIAAKLEIDEFGEPNSMLVWGDPKGDEFTSRALMLDNQHLGYLHLQCGLPCPDQALLDNFVHILSRAIYYNQAQRQAEQLILMEERATIARELHDSLAQSLSYLKIQVSLLKKAMKKLPESDNTPKAERVISEIDTGLSSAYTQLRELLTTFRLAIKEGSFGQALHEMLDQLDDQTTAEITLNNELSTTDLDAHQQVHLLQLIREATINAIKHAQATKIEVSCAESNGIVTVQISDDGIGFERSGEKINHYGMSIMQERAARLKGELRIDSSHDEGCKVTLEYRRD